MEVRVDTARTYMECAHAWLVGVVARVARGTRERANPISSEQRSNLRRRLRPDVNLWVRSVRVCLRKRCSNVDTYLQAADWRRQTFGR